MKKLMVAIAAAAMSFGLFADALNNAYTAPNPASDSWNDGLWSGDGVANVTSIDGFLQIKSPSAAVTRKIVADGTFSVTSNVFFDVDLDLLGQVLDEVPAVDSTAKLALFVLDPAEIDTGITPAPAAGLYAIAGGENGGQVLYRLNAALDELTNGVNKITVKGYDNVLKGDTENAGFIVYTRGAAVEGEATACEIADGFTVDGTGKWTRCFDSNTYLTNKTISKLADKRSSILLNLLDGVDGKSFAGLDFLGNANVATVTMNDVGFSYIPADANDMIITLGTGITGVADPAGIWDASSGVVTGLGTITLSADGKDIFKFVEEVDPTVASIAGDVLTISALAPGEAFNVVATKSIATATIDGDAVKFDDVSTLIEALASAGTASVVLSDDITLGEEEVILTTGEVVIDLNGQTITGSGSADQAAVFYAESGALTINDSEGGGKVAPDGEDVLAVQSGEAVITINAGDYDGAFDLGDGSAVINAGRFVEKEGLDPKAGDAVTLPENKTWSEEPVEGYYILVDEQAETFTVTVEAANEHSSVVVVSNGVAGAVATLEFAETYTLPDDGSYLTVTYTADAEAGYQFEPNQDTEFTLDEDGDEATAPTVEPIEYAITYIYDGKTLTDLPLTSYNVEDTPCDLPTSVTLLDVKFEGWYNDEELTDGPVTEIAAGSKGAKIFYAKATPIVNPLDEEIAETVDETGLDDAQKAAVRENMVKLNTACGGIEEAKAWIAKVYGETKIDGAKLAATTEDLIATSVAFDLPVMSGDVEVAVAAAEEGAGFTFAITDDDGAVSVAKAKLQQMVKYTAALDTAFGDSTDKVTFDENPDETFTARFVEGPAAGFMKVDLTVDKE